MEWNSQFHRLVSLNEDLKKLLEKGYAVSIDSNYLVVRDIPYLDETGELKFGAFISKLVFVNEDIVKPHDHQMFFCGSHPYHLNGNRIANIGGGETKLDLRSTDLVVERSFSHKPLNKAGQFIDYVDHFEKIESYVMLFSGPAMEKYPDVFPYTFNQYDSIGDSVFKFSDTLTSRAEIGDLSQKFKDEVVAIIGLGGTGSYILDFLVKTPVKEIRGFDLDLFYIHNSFRSPGRLDKDEFGKSKAEVYQNRYGNFRTGLHLERKYILVDSVDDLTGVTFAFVCVDKGASRSDIFQLLVKKGIPFIDVGMGLNKDSGQIGGLLRTTYFPAENAQAVVDKKLAPMADYADDVYKVNIQISELNALNAALAVIKYKQIRGFYDDNKSYYNMLFEIKDLHNVGENEL